MPWLDPGEGAMVDGTMTPLDLDAAVTAVVANLTDGVTSSEQILVQIQNLVLDAGAESALIAMAGQSVALLHLLAQVEGRPLADVVQRFVQAGTLSRHEQDLDDGPPEV